MPSEPSARRFLVDELARRAVELAYGRLSVDRWPFVEPAERMIDLLESGALDAALSDQSPPCESSGARRRFSESVEFSHEDWKRRHGIGD
jgi:hypothetical protein